MTLVNELRSHATASSGWWRADACELLVRAADEIERLNAAIVRITDDLPDLVVKASEYETRVSEYDARLSEYETRVTDAQTESRESSERIAVLETRQQELLQTIRRLSQEVPFADEVQGWPAQRAALMAEVGTLKARIRELESQLDVWPQTEISRLVSRCPMGYHDGKLATGRRFKDADMIQWLQELDRARIQLDVATARIRELEAADCPPAGPRDAPIDPDIFSDTIFGLTLCAAEAVLKDMTKYSWIRTLNMGDFERMALAVVRLGKIRTMILGKFPPDPVPQ